MFIFYSRYVDLINDLSKITYLIVVFLASTLIVFDYIYVSYTFDTNRKLP